MTSYIDDSSFVFSSQRQKTPCEIHRPEEIHIYLMFNDCIRLPLKLTETHHTSIIH